VNEDRVKAHLNEPLILSKAEQVTQKTTAFPPVS